jgi:hypothetical protein
MFRRIFKTRTFSRWSRKAGLRDNSLCAAVHEMADGLIEADLGGCIYKKRIRLPGRGKRGSARVIIGMRLEDKWFFLFRFEKNERENIDEHVLAALRRFARELLLLEERQLAQQLELMNLLEICGDTETKPHSC